jgi:hypothetical protein
MKFFMHEALHSYNVKHHNYRLLFSYFVLAVSLAFGVFMSKIFFSNIHGVPTGIDIRSDVYTLVQQLPSGEQRKFNKLIAQLLDGSAYKDDYIIISDLADKEVETSDGKRKEAALSLINPNFFTHVSLPLIKGRLPKLDALREVLVSERFIRMGQFHESEQISIADELFNVVGVISDDYCGLSSICIDVLIDYRNLHYFLSKDLNVWIEKVHTNPDILNEAKQAHSSTMAFFDLFIIDESGDSEVLLNSIDWSYLSREIQLSTGASVMSPDNEQDFTRKVVKGMTANTQADDEIYPVIKIISFSCLIISLICFVLFLVEQHISMNQRKAEITIKTQLGSGDAYWFRFITIEVLLIVVPIMTVVIASITLSLDVVNENYVVKVLNGGSAISPSTLSYLLITLTLILISFFAVFKSILGVRSSLKLNRASASSLAISTSLIKGLISGSFMFLVCGTFLVIVFITSVKDTLSDEKVGKHQDLYTISFKSDTGIPPPASNTAISALNDLGVDFTLYEYEPGIDGPDVSYEVNAIKSNNKLNGFVNFVHDTYFEQFNIKVSSGRLPDKNNFEEVAINKNFATSLGLNGNLIEPEKIYIKEFDYIATVVGVVSDINYNSPRGVSESIIYAYLEEPLQFYKITINAKSQLEANSILNTFAKATGFEGKLKMVKRTDSIIAKNRFYYSLAQYLAPISSIILIVLLLVVLGSIQQDINARRKEIAIRIGLGSPVHLILWIMNRDLLIPLIVGAVTAIIASYLLGRSLTEAWNLSETKLMIDTLLITSIYFTAIILLTLIVIYIKIRAPQTRFLRQ